MTLPFQLLNRPNDLSLQGFPLVWVEGLASAPERSGFASGELQLPEEVAARKALSPEIVTTVIQRTGGVPLFVEKLTRSILESASGRLTEREIPATLHDSLMARLDRLGPAKEVAQLGAVIGSEFSYELIRAIDPLGEENLQAALRNLTQAELIYSHGFPPEATYMGENKPYDQAITEMCAAQLRQYLREYQQAEAFATKALERSEKHQFPPEIAHSKCVLGRARAQLGRVSEGIALIRQRIDSLLKPGLHLSIGSYFSVLAESQERAGAITDALETVEQALHAKPNGLTRRPETLRLRGELRLKQQQEEWAESGFP